MKAMKFVCAFSLCLAEMSASAMCSIKTADSWSEVRSLSRAFTVKCNGFGFPSENSAVFLDIDYTLVDRRNSPSRLMDQEIPRIVEDFKKVLKCKVVALTARSSYIPNRIATEIEMANFGIQLSSDFLKDDGFAFSEKLTQLKEKRIAYTVCRTSGIIYTSLEKKDFPVESKLGDFSFYPTCPHTDMSYSTKGDVLWHMIETCCIDRPNRVIFVDDYKPNVKSVFWACANLGIPVLAIHFVPNM
ncbi:MAG: DUF2608 domain-containing protein [Holosporaceae bacterium]|jgi:hypothetical protein|nr:DUF2608 domain-containing protein [Holosporaceae bacterium]